jgi:hypothetical protein
LRDFYNSTNGAEWSNSSGWLNTGISYCDWYGVSCECPQEFACDISTTVRQIVLTGNNLSGDIGTGIGQLTGIFNIELSNNSITALPDVLYQLNSLFRLIVDYNEIATLPSSLYNSNV